jgi:hypothetical protein
VLVKSGKHSLFDSGDVCFHDQTILRAAQFKDVRADTLILETTRGAHAVPPGFSRAAELERLSVAVRGVLERKGSVLIPAFGLGRTQEILAALALLMRGRPASETTGLYRRAGPDLDRDLRSAGPRDPPQPSRPAAHPRARPPGAVLEGLGGDQPGWWPDLRADRRDDERAYRLP